MWTYGKGNSTQGGMDEFLYEIRFRCQIKWEVGFITENVPIKTWLHVQNNAAVHVQTNQTIHLFIITVTVKIVFNHWFESTCKKYDCELEN